MALIKCTECSKDISDKATNCINCGAPITAKKEKLIQCAKCGSTELTSQKKGFSGGKALGGAVLTGGVGLLAGTIGSKKINITCLKCGHRFKPGEDKVGKKRKEKKEKKEQEELNKSIRENPGKWLMFIILLGCLLGYCNSCL